MPAPDRPFCLTDSILCSAGRAALPFRARRLSRAGACLLLLLAACAMPIQAQTTVDGALRGTVMDTQSAVIPAATLHLRNAATAVDRTALSSPDGAFFFARVPAGEYTLSAESPGFARQTADHVLIELGSVSTIALHLAPAGAVVAVHVNAEDTAPTLDEPQSAATASVVRQNEIEQFPLKDRRWQSLALLTPVASPGSGGDSLLSFRGLAITQNRTSIDGMSDDQRFNNVPRGTSAEPVEEDSAEQQQEPGGVGLNRGAGRRSGISSTFSAEAVREFRIASQNQSALYGRGIGGSITTITRSGSNHLHGSAFYNARSSAWAATNPFSIATSYNNGAPATTMVKPRDLRQQFGGSLGGPVLHDRLFFFYAFDQQHRADVAISSPADPAFYSLTATQNALLGNRGVGTAQIGAALSYLDLLTGEVGRSSNRSIHFGKLDWQAGAKHRFSAQYNRVRYRAPAGLRSSAVVDRGTASLGNAYVSVDAALARWLWTISPSFIHELRFAYGRDLQYQTPQQPLPQEPAIGPGGYAPEVAIGPQGLTFGTPAALGRRAWPDERRAQVADLASWQHRRHFVQFGFDVSFVHDLIDALNNTEGTYHYDSGTTNGRAGGLVDWITDYTFNVNAYPNGGCPAIYASIHYFCFRSYTQSFGEPAVSFNTAELAGFAEYSWRVSRRLSFHAGVRYDYEIVPSPQRPNPELDAIFGQTGATSVFPEDRNNIGPRIGFAWQPFGAKSGVIRAGYGIYYGSVPGATIQSALVNTALPSSTSSIRITPSTVTNCPQVENQGFGYACSYLTTPPAAVSQTTTATVFDHRFRLPMVQQATLAIEREIGAGIVASATYLGNIDRQLPGSVDINIVPSTGTQRFQLQGGAGTVGVRDGQTFVLPIYTARVSSNFGPVTDIVSNSNASYHALSVELRRRSRGGLQLTSSFTWAKAIDYGQGASAMPRTNSQLDPFTNGYDKGPSSLNVPHRIVVGAVWSPKLSHADKWASRAANGWTLSGTFTESSGRPYSYQIFGGTRLAGGRETINGSGGAVYLPTVGRNTLRLPDRSNLNLRLSRTFSVREHVRVRATAEAFNAANHTNYSGINQRAFLVGTTVAGVTPLIFQDAAAIAAEGLNTKPFGTFTEATLGGSGERQIQFGLRVDF